MHFLTGWFIRNPVAANLMMVLILFLGIMTMLSIRIEGFPRIPPDSVVITTTYPDATAGQIDELISQKIESTLEGLEGVRSISSESRNELSLVEVRRAGGEDLNRLLDRIRLRIDSMTDLPMTARRPVIETTAYDFPALYINLHGDTDTVTLQKLSRHLKEELLAQPELSRLKLWGIHERELHIEVDPLIQQQFNLTVADIADKIRASSLDFQAGSLRTRGGDVFIRADDKARFTTEFSKVPILEYANGTTLHLSDIARIEDGFAEGDYLFRFNGDPTTGMEVLIGQKENLLRISEVVHRVVEEFKAQLPSGVDITVWGDSSNYISDRLQLLQSNGLQGLLLVILLLSVFLNVRLAFWVAMGIPISVMGAIAVAGSSWLDYSLNDITTFGLIIALGILVDDAVVVGESVFEERSRNPDPILGTETGVNRVSVATVFGVLTTIAAFFPMLLIENPLGKVLAGFSAVVIFALLFSLVESKFILPAHLAAIKIDDKAKTWISRQWSRLQHAAQAGLRRIRDRVYTPMLAASIRNRYAVLVLFVAMATLGLGLIQLGKIKTVFFPDVPGQIITVDLKMDARAPFQLTQGNVDRIRTIGVAMNQEIQERELLETPPIRSLFILVSSAQSAQLYAELTPVAERPNVKILDVLDEWRERTGQLEGTTQLSFSGSEELAGGFQLKLLSKDPDILALASDEVTSFLKKIDGVGNVWDTLAGGQPELELRIKPAATSLGFDQQTLASQIGYSFGGAEVQKIQRDGDEVRVLVRNSGSSRDTIDDLLQSRIRSSNGDWIPLQSVASVTGSYVSGTLYRESGKAVNTISTSIDRALVAPEEVSQAVFEQLEPKLTQKYPGIQVKKAGELEEMEEIGEGMKRALLLAAVLIYVLMAIPLKSYWQPFVILAIIPFGFVGAALGHLIMDLSLSLMSFFGMLALTGVVINDSLVLITRYNQLREEGLSVHSALQQAGISRFQAIFLTTATTVIGLLPLLSETSEQAQYLIPAAASLAFGELFSTALMLILVPVLLAITDDVKQLVYRRHQTSPISRPIESIDE
ncbi:MAG: efflux RND transporter permease subunit [Candidatus Thiodiazotropha sp. (ex. Lucinisca nassula)]|nr:efflux RND transporter permease subunit [Candidatus Thiodiazotropha sp. (ex. Lucinisca nassula)]